jgi:hypothetical protein
MTHRKVFKETAIMSDANDAPGDQPPAHNRSLDLEQALAHIREALRGLEYGELSIKVQDGVVIQIERTERQRLRKRSPGLS